jgi:hypothetical protein
MFGLEALPQGAKALHGREGLGFWTFWGAAVAALVEVAQNASLIPSQLPLLNFRASPLTAPSRSQGLARSNCLFGQEAVDGLRLDNVQYLGSDMERFSYFVTMVRWPV